MNTTATIPPQWKQEDEQNAAHYARLFSEHGDSHKSMDWNSRASQERRFQVLADIGSLEGKSILDIGCGLGDLYGWLNSKGISIKYTGWDITPSMVEHSSGKYPEAAFRVCNFIDVKDAVESFDYVFASGIFTFRQEAPKLYFQTALQKLFAMSRIGIGVNTLSTWSTKPDEGEFFCDPAEALNFARTLTSRVILRHDYHPGDFTLYLLKADVKV
ncbi:MAG TPA: class I SAM-dependent methyltransferase [Candidatus Methylacidiphilales bacterium]|nr:class I SAM-dependent methyltransferase [Candidatus Methylacidiphilales bacterium]